MVINIQWLFTSEFHVIQIQLTIRTLRYIKAPFEWRASPFHLHSQFCFRSHGVRVKEGVVEYSNINVLYTTLITKAWTHATLGVSSLIKLHQVYYDK